MIHLLVEDDEDVHAIGRAQADVPGGVLFGGRPYQVIRVPKGTVPAHSAAYGQAGVHERIIAATTPPAAEGPTS